MRSTKTRNNPTSVLVDDDLPVPAADDRTPGSAAAPVGGLLWVGVIGYALLVLAGYLVFSSGIATVRGNEMGADRALFTAVNAVTLTGFQHSLRVDDYTAIGKIATLLLTLAGSLLSMIVGAVLVSAVLRLPYRFGRIALTTVLLHGLAIVGGAILLGSSDRSFFAGLFQSTSALANSGLILGSLPDAGSVAAHGLLLPLGIVGGLGITVILEGWDRLVRGRCMSVHAQTVLVAGAAVYLMGAVLIAFLQWTGGAAVADALVTGSAWSLNSRTIGLPFEPAGSVPRTVQWIVLILMAIGAAPGSAAGGIKTTTLAVIARGTRAALRGERVGRIVGIAIAWLVIYGLLVLLTLLLLLAFVPQLPADRLLFIAASATSNAGLSHDPLAIVRESLFVLSAAMLLGKIFPLLILAWTARAARDADIAVG